MAIPREVRSAFETLSADARALALARLCRGRLPQLRWYFALPRRRFYVDTVVGLPHLVSTALPKRLIAAIEGVHGVPSPEKLEELELAFREPITSIQDHDLEIKDPLVEYAYWAFFNLLLSCKEPNDIEKAWLVVRQVCSAVLPPGSTEESDRGIIEPMLNTWKDTWSGLTRGSS